MHEDGPGLFDLPNAASSRFEPARLTQARVRLGVSKTDLAGAVGVSAAAVGQYEAGVNSPRPEVLDRLAKALRPVRDCARNGWPLRGSTSRR